MKRAMWILLIFAVGCAESPRIELRTESGAEVFPLYRAEWRIDNETHNYRMFAAGDNREWLANEGSRYGNGIPQIWYCVDDYDHETQSGELIFMRSVELGGVWRFREGDGEHYLEDRPRYIVIRFTYHGRGAQKGPPDSVAQYAWDNGQWVEQEYISPEVLEIELVPPPQEVLPLGLPVPVSEYLDYAPPSI